MLYGGRILNLKKTVIAVFVAIIIFQVVVLAFLANIIFSPSSNPSPTNMPTSTPNPTSTQTPIQTPIPIPTVSATPSSSPTESSTPTPSYAPSPTPSPTPSPSPTLQTFEFGEWHGQNNSGQLTQEDDYTILSSQANGSIFLYKTVSTTENFNSFSVKFRATNLGGFAIELQRTTYPFYGVFDSDYFIRNAMDLVALGINGSNFVYVIKSGGWGEHVCAEVETNKWYTLNMTCEESGNHVFQRIYDENGILIYETMLYNVYLAGLSVRNFGFGVWNGAEVWITDIATP